MVLAIAVAVGRDPKSLVYLLDVLHRLVLLARRAVPIDLLSGSVDELVAAHLLDAEVVA
jgi:hypothetical protein